MTDQPDPLPTPDAGIITDALFYQLMHVMGLKKPGWITRFLYPVFRPPAARMSNYLVTLDRDIVNIGWNAAIKSFLANFVDDVHISGAENIPLQGPLMVVGNHPAAYDIVILVASIQREDLKVIASDIQLVQMLPNIAQHSIPVPYNIPHRLHTVRTTLDHLQAAGSVFIFPRGNVEPDPSVSPGAVDSLAGWSPSIELFLRRVPDTRCVVAISSGMLSGKWFNNPIVRLWKKYEQRQKVAEIFQIASQIVTGKKPAITPRISFSPVLTLDDLGGQDAPEGALLAAITRKATTMLSNHPHS